MRSLLVFFALAAPSMGYIFVNFWNHCETPVDVVSIDADNEITTEKTVAIGDHYIKLRYQDPVTYTFGKHQTKIHLLFNPFLTAFSLDIRSGLEFPMKIQPTYFQSPNGTAVVCLSNDVNELCPNAIHNDNEEKNDDKVFHTKATALEIHMCYQNKESKAYETEDYDYPDKKNDYAVRNAEQRQRKIKTGEEDYYYDEKL